MGHYLHSLVCHTFPVLPFTIKATKYYNFIYDYVLNSFINRVNTQIYYIVMETQMSKM